MNDIFNLNELQFFLRDNEIPKIKGKPKTFLGIAKQPHYENVISNIYAFFFNVYEEHNLKDLFVKSLLEITQADQKQIRNFTDFDIATEFGTNKKGRIDLLLSNSEQAIIIENKVYHYLDNDLDDYWDSINSEHKIGIILSLQPISKSNYSQYKNADNFISITHLELLKQVQKNLGNYILESNEKYVTFLKDFIQNIINLSTKTMHKKEIDFYFKNQQKIRDTKAFMESVENHVKIEIEKAGNILNGVNLVKPRANSEKDNRIRYFVSQKNENLMYTIGLDHLLSGDNKLILVIELTNETLINRENYNKIDFNEDELTVCFTDNFLNTNFNWAHFALKEYILEAEDIHNLSSFILDKLEKDNFISIFRKLESFLEN